MSISGMAWKSCFRCNVRENPVSGGMTGWGATCGGKVGHSDHRELKPGRACLEDERLPAGQVVGVCVSVGVNFDEAGCSALSLGLSNSSAFGETRIALGETGD